VAVIVENAGHGASVAAPLARKILEKYFEHMPIALDSPDTINTQP